VFPPITTPFVADGSEDVDHDALARNVQRYARKEVAPPALSLT
jgi:dihydrodipicolinate synthase/N-acetylneuraminate lyase